MADIPILENPQLYSPLALAFLGDAVYELMVRREIIKLGNCQPAKLHNACVKRVRASAQAEAYQLLEPMLTEDELSILKRGRNSSSMKAPKTSDPQSYRKATGIEALFGYLYLKGEEKRLEELFLYIFEKIS